MNPTRVRAVLRRAWPWILLALAALFYLKVARRFAVPVLTGPGLAGMEGALVPGARHLVDRAPPRRLARGWIVGFAHGGGRLSFARVRALPGERLVRRARGWCVEGPAGRRVLPRGLELGARWRGRVLPADNYLLLKDHPSSGGVDSRAEGPVPRARIVVRVLFPLWGGT